MCPTSALPSLPSGPDPPPSPQGLRWTQPAPSLEASHTSRSALSRPPGVHSRPLGCAWVIFKNQNQIKSLPCLTPSRDFPSHLGKKPKDFAMPQKAQHGTVWLPATSWAASQVTLPVTRCDPGTSASFSPSARQAAPKLGAFVVAVSSVWSTLRPDFPSCLTSDATSPPTLCLSPHS